MLKIKFVLLMMFVFMVGESAAEESATQKGSIVFEGDFKINTVSGDADERSLSRYVQFGASAMYMFFPGIAGGIETGKFEFEFYGNKAGISYIGPKLAFYIGGRGRSWYPYVEFYYHSLNVDAEFEDAWIEQEKAEGYQIGAGLGYAAFVSRHAAFRGVLFYNKQSLSIANYDYEDGHLWGIKLGLSYFIF